MVPEVNTILTNGSCGVMSLTTTTSSIIQMTCRENDMDRYTLCQYTECITTEDQMCHFPFKYAGRVYDTCITLGNNEGEPWCSTLVDQDNNHISGSEQICRPSCRVTDCPIGYYRAEEDHTCYRVNTFKSDVVFQLMHFKYGKIGMIGKKKNSSIHNFFSDLQV
jgi:hypothetical protein